jgi:hypothetical protein
MTRGGGLLASVLYDGDLHAAGPPGLRASRSSD